MIKDKVRVKNLSIGYDNNILIKNADFVIKERDVFIIMGASGCGKSTLLKVLIGLMKPHKGQIFIDGINYIQAQEKDKIEIMKKIGVLYQSGGLFSSMTLEENIALPLQRYTLYSEKNIKDLVSLKLALVGLAGYNDYYPSEISGGMKKRAGLARALSLDPEIVYFDEPTAGLDPLTSAKIDELILNINQNLKTTLVLVTHELSSIFSIGSNSVFIDAQAKSIIAKGRPTDLLRNPPNETVFNFLTRGRRNEKNP